MIHASLGGESLSLPPSLAYVSALYADVLQYL